MSLRKKYRQQVKKEILLAAKKIFYKEGYSARMEKIAQKAGLSIGSLYNYFKNKDELYLELLSQQGKEYMATMACTLSEEQKFVDLFTAFLEMEAEFLENNQDFFRAHICRMVSDPHFPFREVKQMKALHEDYLQIVVALMQKGIDEGVLAPNPPEELAAFLDSIMRGFSLPTLLDDTRPNLKERLQLIQKFFLDGTRQRF